MAYSVQGLAVEHGYVALPVALPQHLLHQLAIQNLKGSPESGYALTSERRRASLFNTNDGTHLTFVLALPSTSYKCTNHSLSYYDELTAFAKSKLNCESRVVFPAPVGPVNITNSPPLKPLQILTSCQEEVS